MGLVVIAVGGQDPITAFLATAQALFFQQPGHALAPVAATHFAQFLFDAGSAVGLTDFPRRGRWAGPGVFPTDKNRKGKLLNKDKEPGWNARVSSRGSVRIARRGFGEDAQGFF